MGKTINIYKGYTSAQLKTRSTIPKQADIVDNTTSIDCSNIILSEVRSDISESGYNLSDLCTSSSINVYSQFRPGWWIKEGGILEPKLPTTEYSLGDFAGYNNNAIAPYKDNYNTGVSYPFPAGGNPTIYVTVNVSEVDWTDALIAGIDGVGMQVLQGASIKATATALSYTDSRHQNGFDFSETFSSSVFTNYTVRVYFTKGGIEEVPIPGISDYTVTVTPLIPTYIRNIDMDAALRLIYPDPDEVVWNIASLNTTTDTYTLTNLAIDTDEDGEGDVQRFNMDLWARLNEGSWSQVQDNQFMNGVNGFSVTNDALPWAIGVYGDFVDFELRDGL